MERGITNCMDRPKLKMPPEWQFQTAIWLSWPWNRETWPGNLEAAQAEFVGFLSAIAETQSVSLMASDESRSAAERQLESIPPAARTNITLINIPTNDAWARDYAPTFVRNESGDLMAIDWNYNGWGGKYPPFDRDQAVARRVADHLGITRWSPDLCFEGGAIEVNDSGVLLTTRSCALDPNRNPGQSLEQIEQTLGQCLGTTKTIWLSGSALEGDDTDGHIDQLARFTDDETVVHAWTHHPNDPQRTALEKNYDDLRRQLADVGLSHYRLVKLPIPAPIEFQGRRIPASYCNFLITNELVIVPQFDRPEDERALEILRPLFANRHVIGLPSLNLSVGLGSFHCLSQQQGPNWTTPGFSTLQPAGHS